MKVRQFINYLYIVLALLFVFAPVFSLVLFSFQDKKIQSFPIESFTTKWYSLALSNPNIMEGLFNSILVGVVVGIISTILGFISAYYITRIKPKNSMLYILLISLPVVVPLILSGLALLMYFQQIHLSGTLLAVIIAHICYTSPFTMAIIRNVYENMNIETEYAAINLGAKNRQVIQHIVIPQLWPALASSFFLAFLISWDEFILAWYLGGFEKTLPVVIYGMIGTSFDPSLNAIGTINMGVSVILLIVVAIFILFTGRKSKISN